MNVKFFHADLLEDAQRTLRDVPGVSPGRYFHFYGAHVNVGAQRPEARLLYQSSNQCTVRRALAIWPSKDGLLVMEI